MSCVMLDVTCVKLDEDVTCHIGCDISVMCWM